MFFILFVITDCFDSSFPPLNMTSFNFEAFLIFVDETHQSAGLSFFESIDESVGITSCKNLT